MTYYRLLLGATMLATIGCTTTPNKEDRAEVDMVESNDIEGQVFEVKYLNSAVFDKTLAMYASQDAGVIDVNVSTGMSINNIPQRLDDIFVTAVDHGAEFNLIDQRDEVKMRSVTAIMALISAYSNYTKVRDVYRDFRDDRAQKKLGNYAINVYYNVDNGDISHITFTHHDFDE